MSGRIIPMRDGGCAETQELLPWLVSGSLSPLEEAKARAHLAGCPMCQGELEIEQRIREQVATFPTQADEAWRAFRPRVANRKPFWGSRAFVGWAIAAQFVLLVGGVAITRLPRPATYHALGASAAPATADMLVMFRPGATRSADALGLARGRRAAGGRADGGRRLSALHAAREPQARADLALGGRRGHPGPAPRSGRELVRRFSLTLAALLGLVLIAGTPPRVRAEEAGDASAQRILVMLRLPPEHARAGGVSGDAYDEGAGRAARRRLATRLARDRGLKVESDWPLPTLGVDCFVMVVPRARDAG